MKKITFIYILAIAAIAGCSPKKPVEKTVLGLGTDYFQFPSVMNGRVKEVKELAFWASEENGQVKKGELITWKELDSIGSSQDFIAGFSDVGELTKYERVKDGNIPVVSDLGTVENGKVTKWESKRNDTLIMTVIPEYDAKGTPTVFKGYRPLADTLVYRGEIAYDIQGNYIKLEFFNPDNKRTWYWMLTRNPEGRVIEARAFNKNDSLQMTFTNGYDEHGFLNLQEVKTEKTNVTNKWEGNVINSDDHDNWIQAVEKIDNGKYLIMIERTYVYY